MTTKRKNKNSSHKPQSQKPQKPPKHQKSAKKKKILQPKSRYAQIENFLRDPIRDLIDKCLLAEFRPNIIFLTRKINSMMDLPKTGLLGTKFANAESRAISTTKIAIQNLVRKHMWFKDIDMDLIYTDINQDDKVIILKEDTCDYLIYRYAESLGIDCAELPEFHTFYISYFVNEKRKRRFYVFGDFTPEGLKEYETLVRIINQDNIIQRNGKGYEDLPKKIQCKKIGLNQVDIIDEDGIMMSISKKLRNKDFYLLTQGREYYLNIFSDRGLLQERIEEVSND